MHRRARLSIAGIPWHIIQRGSNRSACFYAEADYLRYLDNLATLSVRFGCAGQSRAEPRDRPRFFLPLVLLNAKRSVLLFMNAPPSDRQPLSCLVEPG